VNTTNDGSTIPVEDSGTAISDSLIDFNFATGGTYFIQVHAQDGSAPAAGTSYRLNVSIAGHPVDANAPTNDFASGDLDIAGDVTIVGVGESTVIDANSLDRVFEVLAGGSLTITNATVTGGFAETGGGILVGTSTVFGGTRGSVNLNRVSVAENRAIRGGGITAIGETTITNSTISGNTSVQRGGGILQAYDTSGGFYENSVRFSTISGNVATEKSAQAVFVSGGTLRIDSALVSNHKAGETTILVDTVPPIGPPATINLTRTTISGNTDNELVTIEGGLLDLLSSTITGNTSNTALKLNYFGYVSDNLIAGNGGVDFAASGYVLSIGGNLIGNVEGGVNGQIGQKLFQDPNTLPDGVTAPDIIQSDATLSIGPLADNGGPTLTHSLLEGSRAIDGASIKAGFFAESEPNDKPNLGQAQSLEAGDGDWLQLIRENEPTIPFSLQRPHVTIQGTGDGTFDYFSFNVEDIFGGNEFIFDIDIDRSVSGGMDSELFLFNADTGALVASNDDAAVLDPGSTSTLDSFLTATLAAGNYVIGVGRFGSTTGGSPLEIVGNPPQLGDTYTLHVVAESHQNIFGFGADQRGLVSPRDGSGDGRAASDIGAFESSDGVVEGGVYFDRDGDRTRDADEPGLAGRTVFIDNNQNGVLDRGEPFTETIADDPTTVQIVETGRYTLNSVVPGVVAVSQVLEREFIRTENGFGDVIRVSLAADSTESIESSFEPSLSADGQFTAYTQFTDAAETVAKYLVHDRQSGEVFEVPLPTGEVATAAAAEGVLVSSISDNGNLIAFVAKQATGFQNVFVYNRRAEVDAVKVSSNANGDSRDPQISADGKFITFTSDASNLVAGDGNGVADVFVYDVINQTTTRVSVPAAGGEGNGVSHRPTISGDGRFVAFTSAATNLVAGDSNGNDDVFVVDTMTSALQLVTTGFDATSSTVMAPEISDNGRFVVYQSSATHLTLADTAGIDDIFVFDRVNASTDLVSRDIAGLPATDSSISPSISADGRFIAFESLAEIVPGVVPAAGVTATYVAEFADTTDQADSPRAFSSIELASQNRVNELGNSTRVAPVKTAISSNGAFVASETFSSNLAGNDFNGKRDIYVRSTAGSSQSTFTTFNIFAGEAVTDFNLGTLPRPGEISGQVFEDQSRIGADAFGPGIEGATVYMDLNGDRSFNEGEPTAITDALGNYIFEDVPAFQEYSLGAFKPGFEQVLPSVIRGGVLGLFLPAGGTARNRDFGFIESETVGQSADGSSIAGVIFVDANEDGIQQGSEAGIAGTTVFLDFNDDGIRNFN
ncbi:MAG: choice-of-anchor Q domain-containing protein, partial [Rubripirellula sp.]